MLQELNQVISTSLFKKRCWRFVYERKMFTGSPTPVTSSPGHWFKFPNWRNSCLLINQRQPFRTALRIPYSSFEVLRSIRSVLQEMSSLLTYTLRNTRGVGVKGDKTGFLDSSTMSIVVDLHLIPNANIGYSDTIMQIMSTLTEFWRDNDIYTWAIISHNNYISIAIQYLAT